MKPLHTPGPWHVDSVPCDTGKIFIHSGDAGADDRRDIADVHQWYGHKAQMANAQLIAAAPELLDALECAEGVVHWAIEQHGASAEAVLKKVRAAIRKAKGQT